MERISVNFYARRFYFQVMCNPFNSSCPLYTGRCTKKRVDYVAASLILDMVNSFVLFKPATFKKIRSVFHDNSKIRWYSGGQKRSLPSYLSLLSSSETIVKFQYIYILESHNKPSKYKNFHEPCYFKGSAKIYRSCV